MIHDTGIVRPTMKDGTDRKPYPRFPTVPFQMALSDP